eukprot:984709-Amphidinium_carterae.2
MSGVDEDGERLMPCLTGLDKQTSYPPCVLLPSKTITSSYVVEIVIDFLERLGHQTVMKKVQAFRGAEKTLIKHTPRYSGQSSIYRLGLPSFFMGYFKVSDKFEWTDQLPDEQWCKLWWEVSYAGNLARHVRRAKAHTVWQRRIWLGNTERSDEHVIGTLSGIFQARDVKRLTPERQYDSVLRKGFAYPRT